MVSGLSLCIGTETKRGETRAALVPKDAGELLRQRRNIGLQRYPERCVRSSEYRRFGIPVVDSTEDYSVVAATKEFSPREGDPKAIHPDQILLAFHHSHKGQLHNMEMLERALAQRASLFDYELFVRNGVQVVSTSQFAGLAGMYNALWTFGQRQQQEGRPSVFSELPGPRHFNTVMNMRRILQSVRPVRENLRMLIVGSGACGEGALEGASWLGIPRISPREVLRATRPGPWVSVLRTENVVERKKGGPYDRDEYRRKGNSAYQSSFGNYLGRFNVLVFCSYWSPRFPKLLPQELMLGEANHLPEVVSDVTCDLQGSLGCTQRENTIDDPVSTYFPQTHQTHPGFWGHHGMNVTAVSNLPAQLALSCSEHVSKVLLGVLPPLLSMDYSKSLRRSGLPEEYWPGFISYKGDLRPGYQALATHFSWNQFFVESQN